MTKLAVLPKGLRTHSQLGLGKGNVIWSKGNNDGETLERHNITTVDVSMSRLMFVDSILPRNERAPTTYRTHLIAPAKSIPLKMER